MSYSSKYHPSKLGAEEEIKRGPIPYELMFGHNDHHFAELYPSSYTVTHFTMLTNQYIVKVSYGRRS